MIFMMTKMHMIRADPVQNFFRYFRDDLVPGRGAGRALRVDFDQS